MQLYKLFFKTSEVRIKNFRSIEYVEVNLADINILIGQNNCGKSNFLRAINVALSNTYPVSEQDIFVSDGEVLTKAKTSIIDIKLRPTKEDGTFDNQFSDFWTSVFTDKWITTDETFGSYVGVRTIIEYDSKFDQYMISKRNIPQWNTSIDTAVCGRKQGFTSDMQSYIMCFYMDAQRDILGDIKSKKSYFGRATSGRDMPEELVRDIETQLNDINAKLVENTPALSDTQAMIAEIGQVIGSKDSKLTIEPISRSLSDLHRGMDVKFSDGRGPSLSVAEYGMGTRSWISFLTLSAYISYLIKSIKKDDDEAELFAFLALEEPEAHLHSLAQKKLFGQIKTFDGQKIISTHSSSIVAQARIEDFIHLYKAEGRTTAHRIEKDVYKTEEIAKIQREFILSKGDILFSTAVVLAEGITEELALPVYFYQYFKCDANAAGVSILGIGGQHYKTFLRLLKDFHIPWFIFSDGEPSARNTVAKAIMAVYSQEISEFNNVVVVIEEGNDYEDHLVDNGYSEYMIAAIDKYEKELREEKDPDGAAADPRPFFERFFEKYKRTHSIEGIDEDLLRKEALLECCQKKDGKAKYAYLIAEEIVAAAPDGDKIPPKVLDLFREVAKELIGGDPGED